ncbi:hypothetical protein BDN67DRAFT_522955 [Paxillus ammoniavirescens]|nr:hypothetical protein BDN67DRAFT_522955 [Paxillus ammoniavirescens]
MPYHFGTSSTSFMLVSSHDLINRCPKDIPKLISSANALVGTHLDVGRKVCKIASPSGNMMDTNLISTFPSQAKCAFLGHLGEMTRDGPIPSLCPCARDTFSQQSAILRLGQPVTIIRGVGSTREVSRTPKRTCDACDGRDGDGETMTQSNWWTPQSYTS